MASRELRRKLRRNPGPSWGYSFLARADAVLPSPIFEFLFGLGTWVAVAAMGEERRCSRQYLTAVLGRPPEAGEIWRHFLEFGAALMRKLRAGEGRPHRCVGGPDCGPFRSLMASGRPALLGTFHVGDSDLLGFMLGEFGRPVAMIRLQVGNARDTRQLARRMGESIAFIWVNETEKLLFALKDAVQSGSTIAMECDRVGYSSKLEAFEFLGCRRLFPFSIYHLALIFRLPVAFCVGLPDGEGQSLVHGSTVFDPDTSSKASNLSRARVHFQEYLFFLEDLLRQNPYLWFNFVPLNPRAGPETAAT